VADGAAAELQHRVFAEIGQQLVQLAGMDAARGKLLSPAAEAFRYFIIERAKSTCAPTTRRCWPAGAEGPYGASRKQPLARR